MCAITSSTHTFGYQETKGKQMCAFHRIFCAAKVALVFFFVLQRLHWVSFQLHLFWSLREERHLDFYWRRRRCECTVCWRQLCPICAKKLGFSAKADPKYHQKIPTLCKIAPSSSINRFRNAKRIIIVMASVNIEALKSMTAFPVTNS